MGILRLGEAAREIKRQRTALGITQKKLAALAGISQAAIAKIEKSPESYKPGYAAICSLFEALEQESRKASPKALENRVVEEIMHKKIVSISPKESFRRALELMKGRNFSQLPVVDERGAVLGTIYQRQIADMLLEGRNPEAVLAEDMMEPALPQVDGKTPLKRAKAILEQWPAILVSENQKVIGILTSYDWFKVV